jgi:hypothetical protein
MAANKTEYLTVDKIAELEDSIGFLSNYKPAKGSTVHQINNKSGKMQIYWTMLLRELGEININRERIIAEFVQAASKK